MGILDNIRDGIIEEQQLSSDMYELADRAKAVHILQDMGFKCHEVQSKTQTKKACFAICCCYDVGGRGYVERYLKLTGKAPTVSFRKGD